MFLLLSSNPKKELKMKEIFIIKDDFEDFNEINDFFIKKDTKIQSFELKELNGIDGSKSTLIVNQKFEEKSGGKSNLLKIYQDDT